MADIHAFAETSPAGQMLYNENTRPTGRFCCAGIVAEYNPFHNGHLYHLTQTRRMTGADYVIAVMSGDFVQRGEPAVVDKYTRTRMALEAGVDLVIELPCLFSTSSAEDFAGCAVRILDQLKVVNDICFGSELGDTDPLWETARILVKEPEEYSQLLKTFLRKGITFPKARSLALKECLERLPEETLDLPNNILGVEYCKAILLQTSRLRPVAILRRGHGYHDPDMGGEFASATAIRKALGSLSHTESRNLLKKQMPEQAYQALVNGHPMFADDVSSMLNYRLLELLNDQTPLSRYLDLSRELADRLRNRILDFSSFTKRCYSLKTKQYTYTRISRCLTHVLLDITQEEFSVYKASDYCSYARVLGFKKSAAPLLSAIKKNSPLPLITKTADASAILSGQSLHLFHKDLFASHLYQAAVSAKYGIPVLNEYNRSPVMI